MISITINHVTILKIDFEIIKMDEEIFSQPPHRNNTQHQNSQQNYRSSTPKHERQINQLQSTEETQSDPPGIDNTETTELHLNHVTFESIYDESETEINAFNKLPKQKKPFPKL